MTLNEIMKNLSIKRRGRILLISNQSKKREGKTFFIPWYYNLKLDCWIGTKRWYGNNNKSSLKIECIPGTLDWWGVAKVTFPILPYNHPVRIKLEKYYIENKQDLK